MTAQTGTVFDLSFPDFTERGKSVSYWSSNILTNTAPAPTSTHNSSTNLDLLSAAIHGTLTDNPLTSLVTKNHGSTRSGGFDVNHRGPSDIEAGGYDWFEKVYVEPTSASIKVLASTDIDINTFSTHRYKAVNLASTTLDTGAGTSMTVEPTYAYTQNPFVSLDTVFTATANGPASYVGTITYDYDTGGEVFNITIVRVLDAPWRPLDKFSESLEWKTNIIPARNLETRAALREYPRITYDYEFLLLETEINDFRVAASNPEIPLLTPLWYDEYLVGSITAGAVTITVDTASSEFIDGGYVYIADEGGDYEFIEITTVGSGVLNLYSAVVNTYTNAAAAPAQLTVVAKASYRELNNNVYKGKLSVIGYGVIERPPVAQIEHSGVAILSGPSVIPKTLNAAFSTKGKYLDNSTGVVRFKAVENRVRNSLDHLWKVSGYADRKALKDWIYSRVGRQKKFLAPTFQNDFFLASPYLGGTAMDILETHFETPFYFQVKLQTDVIYYGTCSSKTTTGGVDTLTINALGSAFTDSDVSTFSVMFENRYASDKFKITYTNHEIAELKTTTTGV